MYLLAIATCYIIKEENRTFKSEYIISQSLMMACKKMRYDGIAYYSRRVDNEVFALCAINLVLFVDYIGEYSDMIKHLKIDDAFNYSLYKQLNNSLKYRDYELRSIHTGTSRILETLNANIHTEKQIFIILISFYSQHGKIKIKSHGVSRFKYFQK